MLLAITPQDQFETSQIVQIPDAHDEDMEEMHSEGYTLYRFEPNFYRYERFLGAGKWEEVQRLRLGTGD